MAHQQAVLVNKLIWNTPLKNKYYLSPLLVDAIHLIGGQEDRQIHMRFWRGDKYKDRFYNFNDHYFSFEQELPPGPYTVTASVHWRGDWSDENGVEEFYIRTPPE